MQRDTLLLGGLLNDLRHFTGIRSKSAIQTVSHALSDSYPHTDYPNGDDTAVIKTENGYDLFAAEGFLSEFVAKDPWFAGWCGLMVNISDIAAMGGRPTAVVNTLWGKDDDRAQQILKGLSDASNVFQLPIVGGHTSFHGGSSQLAVSIVGKASSLLSSFTAQAGHALVAAIDLRGAYRQPFLNWNAATTAPPERLRGDIALLPKIAEQQLAHSAKDISQAGVLGACLMLLESSNVGATIQLENIPKPREVDWHEWLRSFPSFGYIFTTPQHKLNTLLDCFQARDITASAIGEITSQLTVDVSYDNQSEIFWDISQEPLTGMGNNVPAITDSNLMRTNHA